jgi:hypothetical protein
MHKIPITQLGESQWRRQYLKGPVVEPIERINPDLPGGWIIACIVAGSIAAVAFAYLVAVSVPYMWRTLCL